MSAGTTATTMRDAALEYAARGVRVFPVWNVQDGRCRCGVATCKDQGKHPLGALVPHGLKDATTDPDVIMRWWTQYPDAYIAMPTGWCLVLDVDPRHGGDVTLAEYEREYAPLPETPEVLTGGGGRHIYFAMPSPELGNSPGSLGAGLDIRGAGGYVLLPPSGHLSGGTYADEVMHPLFDTPLAPMPGWLLLLARTPPSSNGAGPQEATDWAALLTGAAEGKRHGIALKIAGHYLGKHLPPGEVEQIMAPWVARCVPPYDLADVRRIIGDLAAKDATRATNSAPSWPLYDGAETWGFPPPHPCIDRLLMLEGVTWIGGRPKSFKSLLVLYLCLCVAAHRAVAANHFTVQATPRILYVFREDGGARVELRRDEIVAAWAGRPARCAIRFVIRPHLDLLNAAHVAWLRDTCRHEGITLLVLDTWTALSPSADPMAPKDQAQLAAVVVQLAQDIAGHVIVVDHSRKNRPDGQPLSSADIFGPLQKWAAADNTIMLERVGSSSRVEVYVEGKDIDSAQFFFEVSPRGSGLEKFAYAGTVADLADAQRAIGDKNRQAIRLVVSSSGSPLSRDEIGQRLVAEEITLAAETVKKHLAGLVKDGVLRVVGQGRATKYVVTVSIPSHPIPLPTQQSLYEPTT